MKNIKPIFDWAIQKGDSKIVDRILVNLLPLLLKNNILLTSQSISGSKTIEVDSEIYELIKNSAQTLVGENYEQ